MRREAMLMRLNAARRCFVIDEWLNSIWLGIIRCPACNREVKKPGLLQLYEAAHH
jgi:hypothetical protein